MHPEPFIHRFIKIFQLYPFPPPSSFVGPIYYILYYYYNYYLVLGKEKNGGQSAKQKFIFIFIS